MLPELRHASGQSDLEVDRVRPIEGVVPMNLDLDSGHQDTSRRGETEAPDAPTLRWQAMGGCAVDAGTSIQIA